MMSRALRNVFLNVECVYHHRRSVGGNHPKTETAHAWSDADGNLPPCLAFNPLLIRVTVKVSIVAAARKEKRE
jgi:hypothetical protein